MKRLALITAAVLISLPSVAHARTTWTALMVKAGDNNAMIMLDAIDASHAWFVGVDSSTGNSQLMGWRTTDGKNLVSMGLPSSSGGQQSMLMPTAMAFSDENNGYMGATEIEMKLPPVTHHRIYKTTNGGMSWSVMLDDLEKPVKVLRSMPTGEIFGLTEGKFISIKGDQYTEVDLPQVTDKILPREVGMVNLECGFVVGGRSWPDEGDNPPPGEGIVWKTTDGGQSWQVVSSGLPFNAHAVSFVSGLTGWIGGTDGDRAYLYHTTDGGQSWQELTLPDHPATGIMGDNEPHPLTDVIHIRFFDHNRGIVVAHACISNCKPSEQGGGDDGEEQQQPTVLTAVLWTEDGGQTWEFDSDVEEAMKAGDFMPEMMVFSPMFAVKFPSPNYGFMAGKNLMVLAYSASNPVEEPDGYPSCDESPDNPGDTNNGTGDSSGTGDGGSSSSDGGCSCTTPGAPVHVPWLAMMLIAMGLLVLRKRA